MSLQRLWYVIYGQVKLSYYWLRWLFIGDVYITHPTEANNNFDDMITKTSDQITADLNAAEAIEDSRKWEAAEGWHAATVVESINNRIVFHPGNGIVMKTFVNKQTGEVRFYWAQAIEGNNIYKADR